MLSSWGAEHLQGLSIYYMLQKYTDPDNGEPGLRSLNSQAPNNVFKMFRDWGSVGLGFRGMLQQNSQGLG